MTRVKEMKKANNETTMMIGRSCMLLRSYPQFDVGRTSDQLAVLLLSQVRLRVARFQLLPKG